MTRREHLNKLAAMFQTFAMLTDKLPSDDKRKVWDAFTNAMGVYLEVTEGREECQE